MHVSEHGGLSVVRLGVPDDPELAERGYEVVQVLLAAQAGQQERFRRLPCFEQTPSFIVEVLIQCQY